MAAIQEGGQNEQQQQQPAHNSSYNAETMRCLTRFFHPGISKMSRESLHSIHHNLTHYVFIIQRIKLLQIYKTFKSPQEQQ